MRNRLVLSRIGLFLFVLASCSSAGTVTPDLPSTNPPPVDTALPATPTDPPTMTSTVPPTSTPTLSVDLYAVGDINLARTVGQQVLSQGPQVVFAGVQSTLDQADVLVGNLECAITASNNPQPKRYTFAAPPGTAQALDLAGFDVLSLANNHAMDYGAAGLTDTLASLSQNGIAGVGAGANDAAAHMPVILERNGLRLAFLAYVAVPPEEGGFDIHQWIATDSKAGVAWADPARITADVTAAKKQANLVVVLLHSGYEIGAVLPNLSEDQRAAAQAAIDAGAALVIGSHPHFLQSIERYHGGLIAYSLGNFVFDDYLGVADATVILRVHLTPAGVKSYDWLPVLIQNGLPELVEPGSVPAIGTLVAPDNP